MTSSKSWSQYWLQGHKTSFGHSFDDCYEGIIKSEWNDIFKGLTTQGAILDLCTGNASLIRLAKQSMSNFSQISFTGIDYADIYVEDDLLALSNVKLLFNENIEKLPFDSDVFDLVISNYGIEYSCLEKSLVEVARVVKSGGRIAFICHHIESSIIKKSQQELFMLNDIYKDSGAIECLEYLVNSLVADNVEKNNDNAEHWRIKLNECLAVLADTYGVIFYDGDFISFLKFVLKPTTKAKLNALEDFKNEMFDYRSRLNDMVNAALTPLKLDNIYLTLSKLGIDITAQTPISTEDGCIAYKIIGIKS